MSMDYQQAELPEQADFQALMEALMAQGSSDCPTPSSDECPLCRNTGWMEVAPRTVTECPCQAVSRERQRIRESGLERLVGLMTFDAFRAEEPWQQKALGVARRWTDQALPGGAGRAETDRAETGRAETGRAEGPSAGKAWLFIGGAVGSGKTHLCTAACGELLHAGRAVRYMLWPEEARALKAAVNDAEAFAALIRPLQRVEVLYIDDLFKVQRAFGSTAAVTPAEVRVAFELIDARYRADKPTVISCEWLMDELLQMDEGVFSRVYEKSRGFIAQIGRENGRNYRLLKGAEIV